MRHKFLQEMQNLHQLRENTGSLELVEQDDRVILVSDTIPVEELTLFLEENDFDYELTEDTIEVFDSFDELIEELSEYDIHNPSATELLEASAKRKVVVRRGKRKIIFKCAPGQKKIGRRCVKRPSRDLMKMKRRARRAARKARRKRSQANRRRKVSLRRRPHKAHHAKEHKKEHKHHKHEK
jgi:hypothetical protein